MKLTSKECKSGKQGNITKEDLHTFLGIHVIMGYNKLPTYKSYWMTQDDVGVPPMQQSMARDKFELILGCLHHNILKMDPQFKDKLSKVRPMVQSLNENFKKHRSPSEHLCVDESMIRFKGRSSLQQYNPMKPIKRGYKIWCLAENEDTTTSLTYILESQKISTRKNVKTINLVSKSY